MPGCLQPGRPAALRRGLARFFLLFALCLLLPSAQAASLQVSPISLEFKADEPAQALWLSNSGKETLRAQVRVMQWTQNADGDQLQASRNLVASPPMLLIQPGQKQLVRIIRPQVEKSDTEASYRLLIDELPATEGKPASGLQFLLSYSLPVFITPQGLAPASGRNLKRSMPTGLSAEALVQDDKVVLAISNTGRQRLRLSQLVFIDKSGKTHMLEAGLLGYVLSGNRMQWPLSLSPEVFRAGGVFKIRFNDDADSQELPLARPAG